MTKAAGGSGGFFMSKIQFVGAGVPDGPFGRLRFATPK